MAERLNSNLRSRLLIAALLVPAVLVIMVAVLGYRMAAESITSFARVSHTYAVIRETDAALNALLDSETSIRGYALTGRKEFLMPYEKQRPEIPKILDHLDLMTRDNPVQQTNVVILRGLATEKIARMETMILLRSNSGVEAAKDHALDGRGQELMNNIRVTTSLIKDEELRLLEIRQERSRAYADIVQACCLGFLAASLVMLGLFAWLMIKLQRLQNLVTVCAWTQRVQYEGKWVRFEEYLLKRFNVQTTHGMSADAAAKMRAELDVSDKPKTTT